MPSLIGTKVNQVPTVGDLGTLAFQDSNAVNLTGGTAVIDNLTADSINLKVDTDISNIAPSLNLDFANSKTLDPRITFTRASTATFYDGVTTAKAEENLLPYSQEFDNAAWTKTNATVTANSTTAPDGTTTAETLTATAGSTFRPVVNSATTGAASVSHVYSVYAKAGTNNYIQFYSGSGTVWHCNFDITAGAGIVGTSSNCTGSIADAGNGWYRCSVVYTPSSTTVSAAIELVPASNSVRAVQWNPIGTETVFLWGAQLEQRSAVSSYTPTTTQAITNYIPVLQTAASGVARFEHNPITGESLGLEIEEARTNLFTYSDDLANAAWTKSIITLESNVAVAPDGTLTADKLIPTATSDIHRVFRSGATNGVNRTYSLYAKAAGMNYITLGVSSSAANAHFNLIDGTVDQPTSGFVVNATATNVGNGWWRLTYTTATGTNLNIYPAATSTKLGNTTNSTGDGYAGIFVWGVQLEDAVTFATSYIPTVASQVTRAADAASMTGTNFSSWFNNQEGTVYSDFVGVNNVSGTRRVIDMSTGGLLTDRIAVGYSSLTNTRVLITTSNVTQADITVLTGITAGSNVKISVAYKTNDFQQASNATLGTADTSGVVPPMTQLNIGSDGASTTSTILNGTIKKLQYFPKRLTNAELVEMTS